MSTRLYPMYQRGNPQLRIFLPNFWMKIIRPKEPIPPNMVLFQTSIEMTEHDVKNYLTKIYNVPVVDVKLTIKDGLIRKAYGKQYLVKEDDYKEALVTLPRDMSFTYPDIIAEVNKTQQEDKNTFKKSLKEYYMESSKKRIGVPSWFV